MSLTRTVVLKCSNTKCVRFNQRQERTVSVQEVPLIVREPGRRQCVDCGEVMTIVEPGVDPV